MSNWLGEKPPLTKPVSFLFRDWPTWYIWSLDLWVAQDAYSDKQLHLWDVAFSADSQQFAVATTHGTFVFSKVGKRWNAHKAVVACCLFPVAGFVFCSVLFCSAVLCRVVWMVGEFIGDGLLFLGHGFRLFDLFVGVVVVIDDDDDDDDFVFVVVAVLVLAVAVVVVVVVVVVVAAVNSTCLIRFAWTWIQAWHIILKLPKRHHPLWASFSETTIWLPHLGQQPSELWSIPFPDAGPTGS